ncbi:hypothetical protein FCV15_13100, partial [Clostridium botulinum]|nr:hypothetical protein [Clostridium botulinum]
RKTKRYETIEVEYLDRNFKKQKQVFNGFIAQIIQHEMDHFEGVIIKKQQTVIIMYDIVAGTLNIRVKPIGINANISKSSIK